MSRRHLLWSVAAFGVVAGAAAVAYQAPATVNAAEGIHSVRRHAAAHKPQVGSRNTLARLIGSVAPQVRLSDRSAVARLQAAGINWSSSGHCSDRANPHCTSFQGMRMETVERLMLFKWASGCPVTVTGGTEVGHATGQYTHGNGYKADIWANSCVSAYIKHMHYRGIRSDGAAMYGPDANDVYARESTHWDILYK